MRDVERLVDELLDLIGHMETTPAGFERYALFDACESSLGELRRQGLAVGAVESALRRLAHLEASEGRSDVEWAVEAKLRARALRGR